MLMNLEHHVAKRYYFWAIGEVTPEKMRYLTEGICISNKEPITKPSELEIEEHCTYEELITKKRIQQASKVWDKIGKEKSIQEKNINNN